MLLRLIRDHLGPYLPSAAAVAVLQLVQTVMALFLPTLNADLVDRGVVLGDTDHILRVGAVMLAVTAVQVVAAVGAVYFGARAALGFGRDLRAAIFDRVQSFSARELARFGAASLLTRSTNDVQQVQMLVLMTFTMVLAAPLTSIGGIVLALRLDVPLSGLLVIAVPALASIVVLLIRQARPLFRQVQERIDDVARVMREQIAGIRVIRAFVRDDYERERFGKANADLYEVSVGVGRLMASMFPLVMLVVNVSSVGVVWFGAHRIAAGALQIGELTAFLSYLMQILMAVLMATFLLAVVPRAEVCAERIREVLDTRSSVVPPVDPIRTLPEPGKLELAGVGFRYPGAGEPVLSDVDLVARPGEVTAVIGSTGSGKTTLLDLACRLIDPTHGAVRIGGVDAKDLDPVVLSATIGLVPQRPYLFGGTVASNLRYGRPDATDAELWHALDVAQARDFVEAMPGGLDAPISQGGTNVSGGQRQRLAIARALVVRPRIYLLDDAFSALDYATDAALRRALARETADATVVMVGQRVATIRDAHRIVVLDHGRVAATGTHDTLMAGDPTYREIVLSQLTEEEAG